MDLKSLKEKKAMLSESYEVEKILCKPPFEIDSNSLSPPTKFKLDTLGDICRVLKPNSVELSALPDINVSLVDSEHRRFSKVCQLKTLQIETESIQEKSNLVARLQHDITILDEQTRTGVRTIGGLSSERITSDDENLEKVQESLRSFDTKYYEADIDPQLHSRLQTEYEHFHKLKEENQLLVKRLSTIPVKPGFEFTLLNLQKLLEDKQEQLEELKNQVLKASVSE